MNSALMVGIIITTGFIMGEIARRVKLPKVTGYIIAGVLLNPQLSTLIPEDFTQHTDLVTNIALAFITFSIGGTLSFEKLRKLGKGIIAITISEAQVTFLFVAIGFMITLPFITHIHGATWLGTFIPLSLILASIAAPTDPTPALAVSHESNAKGDVTSTILSVAAFDDALGLVNYSIAIVLAEVMILHQGFSIYSSILNPILIIVGSLAMGAAFGIILNLITYIIKDESGGVFVVILFGLLGLCYGFASKFDLDQLLATMTMGMVVINYNVEGDRAFKMLERYTEELIFVIFFTLSGMFLDFSVLTTTVAMVGVYAFFRTIGKFTGTALGGWIAGSTGNVKKYTALGLIPSGGMIVGLALMLKQNPNYSSFADLAISTVIGATVIHEFIGPIFVKLAMRKSGEIPSKPQND